MKESDLSNTSDLDKEFGQVGSTVRRAMLGLLSFGIFCLAALTAPDATILAGDSRIELPLVKIDTRISGFLFFGPAVLVGLSIYLHIFVGRLLVFQKGVQKQTFLFTIDSPAARLVTSLSLYWFAPVVLAAFVWQMLPRPEAKALGVVFGIVICMLGWIQFTRSRGAASAILRATVFGVAVIFGVGLPSAVLNPALAKILLSKRSVDAFAADLRNKDFRGVNFTGADLRQTQFEGAILPDSGLFMLSDMQDANLRNLDWRSANLSGAKLSYANLEGSDLSRSNLSDADLCDAKLRDADLREAVLVGANLDGVDFSDANLSNADLSNTNLNGATLDGADLRKTKFHSACFSTVPPQMPDGWKALPKCDGGNKELSPCELREDPRGGSFESN